MSAARIHGVVLRKWVVMGTRKTTFCPLEVYTVSWINRQKINKHFELFLVMSIMLVIASSNAKSWMMEM